MESDINNIPTHIAIIMDGNRRWARVRNLNVSDGHKKGAETLENIAKYCNKIGIKYLTVYAFSTENWKRSKEEVGALMSLLRFYLDKFAKSADTENIRISTSASQNSGTQLITVPTLQIILSVHPPSFHAHTIPRSNDSKNMIRKPIPPRTSVLPILLFNTSSTSILYL